MVELDFMKIDSKFKTTEFITENGIPSEILLKNGYFAWQICNSPEGNAVYYYIDIVLEDKTNKNPINGRIGGCDKAKDFQETYYSLTNLRRICTRSKGTINGIEEMLEGCAKAFENNISVPKGTKKEQMLEYLILKHLKTERPYELEQPIRIVLQDEELRAAGYGRAYTYYITKAYIREKEYRNDSR